MSDIKQCSTIDAGVFLTHLIYMGCLRDFYTKSTLVFDIAQFFSLILNKASFDS